MKRKTAYLIITVILSVASLCLMQRGAFGIHAVSPASPELKTDSCCDDTSGRLLFGKDFFTDATPVGTAVIPIRNLPRTNPTTTLKNIFIKGGNTVNLSKPFGFAIDSGHYGSEAYSGKTRFIILRRLQI